MSIDNKLCNNCYPAWPGRDIATTRDGRCAYCLRYLDGDALWGELSVLARSHERFVAVHRMRRLLGLYEGLSEMGSPHAPLVVSDVKAALADLEEMEKRRSPGYSDEVHPESPAAPNLPPSMPLLFEEWFAGSKSKWPGVDFRSWVENGMHRQSQLE